MRIRKEDGNGQLINIDGGDNVAPIQYTGATFIRNLKVTINGSSCKKQLSLY